MASNEGGDAKAREVLIYWRLALVPWVTARCASTLQAARCRAFGISLPVRSTSYGGGRSRTFARTPGARHQALEAHPLEAYPSDGGAGSWPIPQAPLRADEARRSDERDQDHGKPSGLDTEAKGLHEDNCEQTSGEAQAESAHPAVAMILDEELGDPNRRAARRRWR